jgi:hypothetical protein
VDLFRSVFGLAKDVQGLRPSEEKNGAVDTSLGSPQDGREALPVVKRHREGVADRLNLSLGLLNERRRYDSLTIPEIATILGLSSVSDLENYFLAEKGCAVRPSRPDCQYIRSPAWLVEVWPRRRTICLPDSWTALSSRGGLLGLIEELKPQRVFFVRCLNGEGDAHVAFRLTDWKYEATRDDWHISDHVGMTGQWQLYELWQSLNKIEERRGLYTITGRDLPEDPYFSLLRGETYPGTLLEDVRYQSYWFDDFTDIDYKCPIAENRYSRHGSGFVQAQRLVRDCRDSRNSSQQERPAPPPH